MRDPVLRSGCKVEDEFSYFFTVFPVFSVFLRCYLFAVFSEKEVSAIFRNMAILVSKLSVENSLRHELHINLWERCCMQFSRK